jgi:LysM repeat protein
MFDQRLTSNGCSWHATNNRSGNMCSITSRKEQNVALAVVIPGRFRESNSASQIYARRRLMVLLTLAAIVLVLLVGTGHVVAKRGGGARAPASAIRPATPATVAAPAAANIYVVQAGDTMWSIGQRFHGRSSLADYVDALISANGGTEIQVSQAVALP